VVLSQRERYIAIGVGAVVALLVLDQVFIEPYTSKRSELSAQLTAANVQKTQNDNLLFREKRMKKIWEEMITGGLKSDPSDAQDQAYDATIDWARECGVELTSLKPQRSTMEKGFEQIGFHAAGNGPMAAMSKLLWRVETASIPFRVTEVQISPRKEGTDDLTIQLSFSTLALVPEPEKTQKQDKNDKPRPIPANEKVNRS
jgi:type II secretory pathway component PulM